jgi:hypothetical protein
MAVQSQLKCYTWVIDAKSGNAESAGPRQRAECLSIERAFPRKMEYITKMSKQSQDNIQALLKVSILATIAGAAISSRLFSVIRYSYLFPIFNL